ncbi:hypothetical protein Tco_0906439 [Tanacetum coccineum]|uniref:Uncharacterized protein n=1 Tax=Tanacetum coccineum TaxID=301880 RepID=A0ABQ5CHM8_9ASTR
MLTKRGDDVASIKRHHHDLRSNDVSTLVMPSEHERPKGTLEDSEGLKVNRGHQRHIAFIVSMKRAGTKSPASRLMIYETRELKEIGRTRTQATSHKDIGALKNNTIVNLAKVSSDYKTEVIVVLTILPEITPEVEAIVVASPTVVLDLILESALKAEPSKAPLSPDYSEEPFEDGALNAAEPLPAQVVSTPPVQITPTLPTEPAYVPHVIPRELSPSSSELSLSSSSETSSSSSTHHLDHYLAGGIKYRLTLYHQHLLGHLRFRGSPAISYQDATTEAIAEPVIPSVHPRQTVEDRGGVADPRARVVASEREITSLRARVRATELSDESSRVSLGIARTGLAEMRYQVRDTAEQLQQCQVS